MIVVGLTGGVATGKSTVAKMFKQRGAIVIDADELAREVVKPDKPAWRQVVKMFGKTVLNPDRTLNRRELGAVVFGNRTKLRQLEHIIHPRVAREQARLTKQAAQKDPHAVVIYDVPLLFEVGIDKRVDTIIVVTADHETQIARLKKRNGLSRTEALRRMRNQMPMALKARKADFVLDGTESRSSLRAKVCGMFAILKSIA